MNSLNYFIYGNELSYHAKIFDILFLIIIIVSTREYELWCPFDGLGSYIFHRKMEKTQPMREEMDGKVFISRQNRQFSSL